jgi:hypothetical protein
MCISERVSRLHDLHDQLLDVARAEVDPTEFRPGSLEMKSLLPNVVDPELLKACA